MIRRNRLLCAKACTSSAGPQGRPGSATGGAPAGGITGSTRGTMGAAASGGAASGGTGGGLGTGGRLTGSPGGGGTTGASGSGGSVGEDGEDKPGIADLVADHLNSPGGPDRHGRVVAMTRAAPGPKPAARRGATRLRAVPAVPSRQCWGQATVFELQYGLLFPAAIVS